MPGPACVLACYQATHSALNCNTTQGPHSMRLKGSQPGKHSCTLLHHVARYCAVCTAAAAPPQAAWDGGRLSLHRMCLAGATSTVHFSAAQNVERLPLLRPCYTQARGEAVRWCSRQKKGFGFGPSRSGFQEGILQGARRADVARALEALSDIPW